MAKIPKHLVLFLRVLASFAIFSFPVNVSGKPPLMFIFGDSSYDVGNTKFFSSTLDPATTWPYGDSVDDPTGRWSDGRIVPDFVGRLIGHPEPIPPILDPKADLSRGASLAIAGATVLGSIYDNTTMILLKQASKLHEFRKNWTPIERAKALYMLNIGADDYLNFAKDYPNASREEQLAHVSQVHKRITQFIIVIFKQAGARKVAVQNLAPLGCLPIVRQDYKTGENCMEMINFMVNIHNKRLPNMLSRVSVVCGPLRYSLFDFNGAILQRINEPSRHGYTDTTTSCCGTGSRNAYGCGYSNVHSKLCSYQKSFLFFDGRHNTEKTNEDIANLFYSGDKHVVSPVNIRDLVGDSRNLNPVLSF